MKETIERDSSGRTNDNGFCQDPSNQYDRWLEEEGGDPRSVAGRHPGAEWRTPYNAAPRHKDAPRFLGEGHQVSIAIGQAAPIQELELEQIQQEIVIFENKGGEL